MQTWLTVRGVQSDLTLLEPLWERPSKDPSSSKHKAAAQAVNGVPQRKEHQLTCSIKVIRGAGRFQESPLIQIKPKLSSTAFIFLLFPPAHTPEENEKVHLHQETPGNRHLRSV